MDSKIFSSFTLLMNAYSTPDMVTHALVLKAQQRLLHLLTFIPSKLRDIPIEAVEFKPASGKWSKKEILGHLIDSAANNHQRFVRIQFEESPHIEYAGDHWVLASHYQTMPLEDLICFWTAYNRHLSLVIERIPENAMNRLCDSGDDTPRSLGWLIVDYVNHLEHHLHQLIEYN